MAMTPQPNLNESSDCEGSVHSSKETNSNAPSTTSMGVLPAISTNGVKERNYLVGNVTAASSWMGADELNRYFPDRRLRLFVGTWNMQRCKLPENVDEFLLPSDEEYLHDIYVVGVQEATPDQRGWEIKLQETLGPSHVLAHSVSHGVLHLAMFVRRDLIWFCSNFEEDRITTRMISQIKTKGAIALSFQFFGTSFLIISAHFRSGETNVKERIEDYQRVCDKIQLPRLISNHNYHGRTKNATERFDYVFWFGDLNFRISQPHQHMKKEVEDPLTYDIIEALKCDQLKGCMKRGRVFQGFEEAAINFLPTYKFNPSSDQYDTSQKLRVPSYTDRILYKSTNSNTVVCSKYNSVTSLKHSDHRPVYAQCDVIIKPGRDSFPLSNGQFKRDIYVEAARKRAHCRSYSHHRSAVCSIL